MSKLILGLIAGLLLGGAGVWFYEHQHGGSEAGEEKKKEEEKKEVSFVQHGTNGETFLKIDAETQARMGLKTEPLASAQLQPEVQAYGHVLDPAPLAALLVESASAKAALEASTHEYERLKLLYDQGQNASARALETARAMMQRDQIQLDSVQPRLLLSWGGAVASLPDLPAFMHSLAERKEALVRVDLSLDEAVKAPPTGGRLAALTAPEHFIPAQFLGPAPSADVQLQSQGFLLLQKTNPLPPGAAVLALLKVPGESLAGVNLPREALVRHEGEVFVYVQTGQDTFARKEIELERPMDGGWFVHEGLKPGDKVVTAGAQQLFSEEVKGQGGE